MKEVLLTSSVLILALLILRRAFREKISRRMQYALWGLVALRLLIPVNLPAADFSVLSVSQPARARIEEQLEERPVYVLPVSAEEMPLTSDSCLIPDPHVILPLEGRYSVIRSEEGRVPVLIDYAFTLPEALNLIWKTGMAVMALWLIGSNLRFWLRLRKRRIPLELPECKYPVYLVEEGLPSPCLFGLIRPAVYLSPAALESEDSLRHVLVHEQTHARQLDPLWSLLRGVCLAVYWFDPLVWWAAAASREDCELSCDEGALKRLGEDERIPYGKTLLRLIPLKKTACGVLLTASTMTSDKKRLKERITHIAENRKMKTTALCAALAVTLAVCAVTFTGCVAMVEPEAPAATVNAIHAAGTAGPVLTIPLTDLSPYEPAKVETLSAPLETGHHHDGHHGGEQDRFLVHAGNSVSDDYATFVWSYGGYLYVSLHSVYLSSFPSDYFLSFPEQEYREEPFTGLLGCDGLKISYDVKLETGACTVNDYYTFAGNGENVEVYLLARTYGQSEAADMDGDGEAELIAADFLDHCQLIFRRDGRLYEADVGGLVRENWPGTGEWTAFSWLPEEGCLHIFYRTYSSDNRQDRQLRFDGENLLLYPIELFSSGGTQP